MVMSGLGHEDFECAGSDSYEIDSWGEADCGLRGGSGMSHDASRHIADNVTGAFGTVDDEGARGSSHRDVARNGRVDRGVGVNHLRNTFP